LSQVYGFARQSSGHVKIYSEVGEGTTVKIYLPRYHGEAVETKAEVVTSDLQAIGCESVLIVEDDESLRSFTGEALREMGYHVFEAANGKMALQILGEQVIDLLLTDVVMPGGVNGRQLADEATKRQPKLKVLFMTGYTRNAIVHHGRLDPGIRMISKPFTYPDLAKAVRARLDYL
jgi:CheY-like chemotaxis protein